MWYKLLTLGISASIGTSISVPHAHQPDGPTVTLCAESQQGPVTIRGLSDGVVDSYYGVPYAAPPVGDLRFAAPHEYQWNVTSLDATRHAPACLQSANDFYDGFGLSEDCLYLDIVAPADFPGNGSLPVLFWIYGGSYVSGSSSFYDGAWIVNQSIQTSQPVIYVAVNYRSGVFGFPNGKEAADAGAANLGLRDIMKALAWVQANIEAFGGDADRVTVFGESSGAILIGHMMLQPDITDLFASAIMQSGAASSIPIGPTNTTWQETFDLLAQYAGCNSTDVADDGCITTFDCLKALSAEALLSAQQKVLSTTEYRAAPSIDGDLIPASPYTLVKEGNFSRVPFISGSMKDEGTFFVPQTIPNNQSVVAQLIASIGPVPPRDDVLAEAFELYPADPALGSPFGTGNETFGFAPIYKQAAAMFGDLFFHAPRRYLMLQSVAHNHPSAWTYQMDMAIPALPQFLGAFHSADIPFVFGLPQMVFANMTGPLVERAMSYNFTLADAEISRQIINHWINFAHHADPNGTPGDDVDPAWPSYGTEANLLRFDIAGSEVVADAFRQEGMQYFLDHPVDFNY